MIVVIVYDRQGRRVRQARRVILLAASSCAGCGLGIVPDAVAIELATPSGARYCGACAHPATRLRTVPHQTAAVPVVPVGREGRRRG